MENISKEKIEELDKVAFDTLSTTNKKLKQIAEQEKTLAQLKSELFVVKLKTEGERKGYMTLLKLFKPTDTPVQEEKL